MVSKLAYPGAKEDCGDHMPSGSPVMRIAVPVETGCDINVARGLPEDQ